MKPPTEAHAVLAHYVCRTEAERVQGAITLDEFQRAFDAYGDRLISTSTWVERALGGQLSDEACLSFDDGLSEQLLLLPMLKDRGITAAWNVYSQVYCGVPHSLERWRWVRNHAFGNLERFYAAWRVKVLMAKAFDYEMRRPGYLDDRGYLTRNDRAFRYWRNEVATPAEYERVMAELEQEAGHIFHFASRCWQPAEHWIQPWELTQLQDAGHLIGLHTHTHPTVFGTLSLEQQQAEWATNRMILNHAVPRQITTASYPCGQMTDASVAWFKANGITLAWGATMKGSIPWECPRLSTGYWT